jgi:predicted amidophosphoribosyltransferase
VSSLVACLSPERCLLCGNQVTETLQKRPGLRSWDRNSLCTGCRASLFSAAPGTRTIRHGEHELLLSGGTASHQELASIVGQLKYHGIRGLAVPLAELTSRGVALAEQVGGPVDVLLPIPLHGRRRRTRGFNQALLIAEGVSGACNLPIDEGILRRRRNTGQQAKIGSEHIEARLMNVAGGFRAKPPEIPGARVGLIDDLITTGATVLAAALALREQGWIVPWAASAGLVGD